jgi:hypothetical protein
MTHRSRRGWRRIRAAVRRRARLPTIGLDTHRTSSDAPPGPGKQTPSDGVTSAIHPFVRDRHLTAHTVGARSAFAQRRRVPGRTRTRHLQTHPSYTPRCGSMTPSQPTPGRPYLPRQMVRTYPRLASPKFWRRWRSGTICWVRGPAIPQLTHLRRPVPALASDSGRGVDAAMPVPEWFSVRRSEATLRRGWTAA